MARRGLTIEVEFTEGAIRVRRLGRTLSLPASPPEPDAAEDADFVIRLDEIDHWDAPDDEEAIDIVELQKILDAIEKQAARHGLSVAFD